MSEVKTTNLTRGEILRGIELGHFKQGDQFIRRDIGKLVTVLSNGSMKYNNLKTDVAFKVVPHEVWDFYVEIEIGDWVTKVVSEKEFEVSEVIKLYHIDDVPTLQVGIAGQTNEWLLKDVRVATPNEIRVAKRAAAFAKKGRLLNEYKIGDVLPRDADSENYLKVLGMDNHGVLLSGGGFRGWVDIASANLPVFFVEDMVREDDNE
jgi:hypothetical protein